MIKSTLFKSSFVVLIARVLGLVFAFSCIYIINVFYNQNIFGVYTVCFTLLQMFSLISVFGINISVFKEIVVLEDSLEAKKTYSKGLKSVIINSIILTILSIAFSKYIAVYIFNKPNIYVYSRIISFGIPFLSISTFNAHILRAKNKFIHFQLIISGITFISFFFLILIINKILNVNSIDYLIYVYLISVLITSIYSCFQINNLGFGLKQNFNCNDYLLNIKKGFEFLIAQSSMQFFNWASIILITVFSTLNDVANLEVIFRITAISSITLGIINSVSAPTFVKYFKSKDYLKLSKYVSQTTSYIFVSALPILLILLIFPKLVLNIFGFNYQSSSLALIFIAIGQFFSAFFGSVGVLLQMSGNEKTFNKILGLSLVVLLVLGFLLTPKFKLNGLALAIMVSTILWNLLSAIVIYKKYNIISFYIPFKK